MKKIGIAILAAMTIVSCNSKKEHPKDYLTLSGTIKNTKDSVLAVTGEGVNKQIKIAANGSFKDTIKVSKKGYHALKIGTQKQMPIYLSNGYDLSLTADGANFTESLQFSGGGADSNNYTISLMGMGKKIGNPMDLFALDKGAFDKKLANIKNGYDSIKQLYPEVDSTLVANSKSQNKRFFDFFEKNYERQHPVAKQRMEAMANLAKGKPSPKFVKYENFKGGKTSLDDLKGKYVYIDLWATWCKPCIGEIPYLQKLEKEYHGKNIEFVSISIDNERTSGTWEKAHESWKKMVADKSLTGVQLYAGKDTDFVSAYQVTGIPRFILIDPNGNIVDNNAPRPSDNELKKVFNELGI